MFSPAEEKKLEYLNLVQLPCYDDGREFTNRTKLDKISEVLSGTPYQKYSFPLFDLYSRRPIDMSSAGNKEVVVLSTHADFVPAIKTPFAKLGNNGVLQGTFDNSATNAAALYLLAEGLLPENVLVAFTGNEESGMRGARMLSSLIGHWFNPRIIALDVTDVGYEDKFFSIENTFSLKKSELNEVLNIARQTGLPGYVYPKALPDEAHAYASCKNKCFSLCVPTKGLMHSNSGCRMKANAYFHYIDTLQHLATNWISINRNEEIDIGGRNI